MKRVRVRGKMVINWEVELPESRMYQGLTSTDPAVEAALSAFHQNVDVFLWGDDKEPVSVYLESCEEDVLIVKDNRGSRVFLN